MARPMRAMDVVTGGMFGRPAGRELTARTWPKADPENYRVTPMRLLSSLARVYSGDRKLGVTFDHSNQMALVIARSRATGILWDVEHLVAGDASSAVDLLVWA